MQNCCHINNTSVAMHYTVSVELEIISPSNSLLGISNF